MKRNNKTKKKKKKERIERYRAWNLQISKVKFVLINDKYLWNRNRCKCEVKKGNKRSDGTRKKYTHINNMYKYIHICY